MVLGFFFSSVVESKKNKNNSHPVQLHLTIFFFEKLPATLRHSFPFPYILYQKCFVTAFQNLQD